ncbi:hypothetical protein SAMN04488038_109198 [Solimonas aquatica]|uniref:Sulphur transport domain-containing protein n=1 Tax=Solimonas aquatica TaxID=489703 RepID=A0A1H9I699_9GAMM|nr:YeeE/YedE family protein [Solimonas aquatica]SEQ70094.1 hypothetical protein SAMN04488038_109198 [Solimonas aquatica]
MKLKLFGALLSGLLFGAGLAMGGMTDPHKVLGFLDISGRWDPSLAFVMGCALLVTIPAFALARRRGAQPLGDERFHLPTQQRVDARLIIGSLLFGLGWGIAGLCPGPAIANLGAAPLAMLVFVSCMAAGMWLHDWLDALPSARGLHTRNHLS